MLNVIDNSKTKNFALVVSFSLALFIAAQITIPFYPVPFTLQTMIVTTAVLYNSKIAFRSTLLYIALGIAGLPVFANWANAIVAFNTPHVGYIFGMLFATAIISWLNLQKTPSKLIMLNLIVFSCGLAPLIYSLGVITALHLGFVVFILSETLKTIVAYVIYRYIRG